MPETGWKEHTLQEGLETACRAPTTRRNAPAINGTSSEGQSGQPNSAAVHEDCGAREDMYESMKHVGCCCL